MHLLLLVACESPDGGSSASIVRPEEHVHDVGTPDTRETEVATTPHDIEANSGGSALPPLAATLTPAEDVGTVATVSWDAAVAGTGWVELREVDGTLHTFSDDSLGSHHVVQLVGQAAGVTYTWQVFSTNEDGAVRSSTPASWTTDAAPEWLPEVTWSAPTANAATQGQVLSTITGDETAVFMLDAEGRYTWWWRPDDGGTALQARLSRDGQALLVMTQDEQFERDIGRIVRIGFDGVVQASTPAPLCHHDFLELPDGRYAFLAADLRDWYGEPVVGDRIDFLDPTSGAIETFWSTWDDLDPLPAMEDTHFYGFGLDWTHANSLFLDEDTGDWLVSLHSLDAVIRVSAGGRMEWQLGGEDGDFDLEGGDPFVRQHSASITAAGVLLFNNSMKEADLEPSAAVEYALDLDEMTFTPIWSFGDQGFYVTTRGSVERIGGGNTLIGWGSSGRITEVDAANNVVWQADFADERPLGYTHFLAEFGG